MSGLLVNLLRGASASGTSVAAPPPPPGWYLGPSSAGRSTAVLASGGAFIGGGSWLFVAAESMPIDQIAWEVTGGGDASSVITVGLYRPRSPGSLTMDLTVKTAAVQATAIAEKTATVAATLARGWYAAIAEATGHSATAPTVRITSGVATGPYVNSTDLLAQSRGGITPQQLPNAVGLPASFALDRSSVNLGHGIVIGVRAA